MNYPFRIHNFVLTYFQLEITYELHPLCLQYVLLQISFFSIKTKNIVKMYEDDG